MPRFEDEETSREGLGWRKRIAALTVALAVAVGAPLMTAGPASAEPASGSISGNVKAAGTPATNMPDASVMASSATGETKSVLTDRNGNYTIAGLAPGDYSIQFTNFGLGIFDQAYVPQWWNNVATEADATVTTVVAGQDASDRDAVLIPGARITGLVTDSNDEPLDDIYVPVWQKVASDWKLIATERTYSGEYWVTPLTVGEYKVGFSDSDAEAEELVGDLYDPQYYPGKSTFEDAETIVIEEAGEVVELAPVKLSEATAPAMPTERLFGDDRYNTAVEISQAYEPGVDVVYVATGASFPDALAAAPAAAKQGGPLLLTTDSSLPAAVKTEIERLQPKKIVVVGGETVVSASVFDELKALAPEIRRDSGGDRFETANTIVRNAFGTSGTTTAFIATARNFPDALAASAAAGAAGAPVILVNGEASNITASTSKLLNDLKVSKLSIAGGTTAVSAKIETALKWIVGSPNVTRFNGEDRYQTSGAINRASFTSSASVYLAVGTGYADALAGAALAGKNKAPLYTVQDHCVPSFVLADIASLGAEKVVLLGGPSALGVGVETLTACSY